MEIRMIPRVAFNSTACLPAQATVALESGKTKLMKDLSGGDRVQVGPEQFSDVFMLTHRLSSGVYEYLYLHSSATSTPLVLTSGHYLLLNGEMRAAKNARVGDVLHLGNGTTSTITQIAVGKDRGLYNPQMVDGRIVMNGVVASTYTTAISASIAHALRTPLRCLFKLSGLEDGSLGTFEERSALGKWLI